MHRRGLARGAGVLLLTAAGVALVWAATLLPIVCPAMMPAPPACSGDGRASVAAIATAVLGVAGLACVAAVTMTRVARSSRLVAGLGAVLAIAIVASPAAVVLQAGFAVDALLLALVASSLALGGGVVALTRSIAEQTGVVG